MVARDGVEPSTFRFSVGRSYQLSYLAVPAASESFSRWAGGKTLPEWDGPRETEWQKGSEIDRLIVLEREGTGLYACRAVHRRSRA